MKTFFITLCLFLGLKPNKCIRQIIDSTVMKKLANTTALPYVQENGKLLGCEYTLECGHMNVVFYQTHFSKGERRLILKGRVIDPISSKGDTL